VVEVAIRQIDGATDVHELHVWEVTSGFPALSAHVLVDEDVDCHQRRLDIEQVLADGFAIEHTTLQVDHRDDVLPTSALGRRIRPRREHH
jgi:cobalt-zinc-cadmium efflux system protein